MRHVSNRDGAEGWGLAKQKGKIAGGGRWGKKEMGHGAKEGACG